MWCRLVRLSSTRRSIRSNLFPCRLLWFAQKRRRQCDSSVAMIMETYFLSLSPSINHTYSVASLAMPLNASSSKWVILLLFKNLFTGSRVGSKENDWLAKVLMPFPGAHSGTITYNPTKFVKLPNVSFRITVSRFSDR